MMALNIEQAAKDLSGAVDLLAGAQRADAVGVVGFCMGGGLALVRRPRCGPTRSRRRRPSTASSRGRRPSPTGRSSTPRCSATSPSSDGFFTPEQGQALESDAAGPRQGRRDPRPPGRRPRLLQRHPARGPRRRGVRSWPGTAPSRSSASAAPFESRLACDIGNRAATRERVADRPPRPAADAHPALRRGHRPRLACGPCPSAPATCPAAPACPSPAPARRCSARAPASRPTWCSSTSRTRWRRRRRRRPGPRWSTPSRTRTGATRSCASGSTTGRRSGPCST